MNQCPNFNCASINHDSAAYCQNCGTPLKVQNTESSVNHLQEALGHDHEFIQQLGEGGMGTVWKARHINLDQYRAIKLLHSELVSNPKIKKWALNEGRKLAKINNPHVITVYDCRETETTVALFMDYINDGSLADLLAKKVKLSWHEAKSIIVGILDGLEAVHENGIVHRDIKPDNVLLANQRGLMRPIIIDFGIAIDGNGSKITRTGAQAGTYEYMSPEQIKTGTATEQSDIYSAGIMLYEILVGELPFLAEEDFALMEQHVHQEPDLSKLPNETPSYVRNAIGLALAKNPQDRFKSCTEFSAALNHEAGKDQANPVKVGERVRVFSPNGQPTNPNVHAKDQFQSQDPSITYQTVATNPSSNHLRHMFTFGIVAGIALVILLALNLKKDPSSPCDKPNPPSDCKPSPGDFSRLKNSKYTNHTLDASIIGSSSSHNKSKKKLTPPAQYIDQDNPLSDFKRSDCGSIIDHTTGYEWLIGPNKNVSWLEAKKWVKELRQCDVRWSLPTKKQADTLRRSQLIAGQGPLISGKRWPAKLDPIFSDIGEGAWIWLQSRRSRGVTLNLNRWVKVTKHLDSPVYTTRVFAIKQQ